MYLITDVNKVLQLDDIANPKTATILISGEGAVDYPPTHLNEKYKDYALEVSLGDEFYLVDRSTNKVLEVIKTPTVIGTLYDKLNGLPHIGLLKIDGVWYSLVSNTAGALLILPVANPVTIRRGVLKLQHLILNTSDNRSVFAINKIDYNGVNGHHRGCRSKSGLVEVSRFHTKTGNGNAHEETIVEIFQPILNVNNRCGSIVRFMGGTDTIITLNHQSHRIHATTEGLNYSDFINKLSNTIDFIDAINRMELLYKMSSGEISYETVGQLCQVIQSVTLERFIRKISTRHDDVYWDLSDLKMWNAHLNTTGVSTRQLKRAFWYFNEIRKN